MFAYRIKYQKPGMWGWLPFGTGWHRDLKSAKEMVGHFNDRGGWPDWLFEVEECLPEDIDHPSKVDFPPRY